MKKLSYFLMLVFVMSIAMTGCRDTKSNEKVENDIEEVGEDIEEGAEDAGEEVEEAAEDLEEEVEDATDDDGMN